MKTPKLLLSALTCVMATSAFAGVIPTHEKHVERLSLKSDGSEMSFVEYFQAWDENDPQPLSEDENFYISRVPMKERFENKATQVDPTMTTDRKFCLWTPMGISDSYWQSLPRYTFDGDNFSMWSYVDSQGGWSLPWVRVPGAYADVTHRNGVANGGGLIFFDSWGGDNSGPNSIVDLLVEQESANEFLYTEKFVKFLRYYGLDGVGVNPEGPIPTPSKFQDFLASCYEYAQSIGWRFNVYWYGVNNNNGSMTLTSTLDNNHVRWFRKNGKQVTNVYMLNYDWAGGYETSQNTAKNSGGSTYDVYAGWDIQGNWLARGPWTTLKNSELSILFWGNHNTNMIYQNSTDYGSSEEATQYCYLVKQEQVFSGGKRNPADRPAVINGLTGASEDAMKKFHGIAEFLPARSVLQELPFVTRFGLGNGKAFYNEGKVTFNNSWFNVGVQDYLPTWRWWITNDNGQVPADAISCGFTYEDAWFAGSAMQVQGATLSSNVRLFKTKFDVAETDDISLTYKLVKGDAANMELFWAFEGSESTLHYAAIDGAKVGEWVTINKKAKEIGMNGKVAVIGLRFKNTPANYDMLLGEFSIIPATTFAPVKPVITTEQSKILKRRSYLGLDIKFSWNVEAPAGHKSHTDKSYPIYNEDVDTWYYEVYVQPNGEDEILCGTTSSWAHYVVSAPVSANKDITQYRVGVCAVAPDGKTKSAITWTNYLEKGITVIDGITRDKDVIKSGDEFTLSLIDPNHPEPSTWIINDASTGKEVKKQIGGYELKTSLPNEGYYDIVVSKVDGSKAYYRAFIQISPEATGKVPSIESISASKTQVDLNESKEPVILSYAGKKNEGNVSRGLELVDPCMFRIPQEFLLKDVNTYSVGLWVKPKNFTYAQFGMSLLTQRNYDMKWPDNNWGAFWVDVWPEKYNDSGKKIMNPNVVSYTMWTSSANANNDFNGNYNKHEIPNMLCCTDSIEYGDGKPAHSLLENAWSHILISYDGTHQRIFYNGKEVAKFKKTKEDYVETWGSKTPQDGDIYIGGSRVYYSGFNGTIDDVQVWHKALSADEVADAMKGYWGREVPADLKGYWTFEDVDYNVDTREFTNRGSLNVVRKAAYIEMKAAGENTSGAQENLVEAKISLQGNPAMDGTLPIETTATFKVTDTTNSIEMTATAGSNNQAEVEFTTNATYNVTLTLANGWGSTTLTNPEYIVVTGGLGVEDNLVTELSVYPNPFIDHVNLLFAEGGNYTVDLYDAQGRQVVSKRHQASAGEVFTLNVDAAQGLYYVVVSKEGKRINTFKVIAQ